MDADRSRREVMRLAGGSLLGLIALAFGFQVLITGSVSGCFLALAAKLLGCVTNLVVQTHGVSPYGRLPPACCQRLTYPS